MGLEAIVAIDRASYGIGYHKRLPWNIPQDLKHFRTVTMGKVCWAARKTYEGLPDLPGRDVRLLTHTTKPTEGVIIGGCSAYRSAWDLIDVFHVTWVEPVEPVLYDVYFHEMCKLQDDFVLTDSRKENYPGGTITFATYHRHPELKYLDLIKDVLTYPIVDSRNAPVFKRIGGSLEFNIRDRFPLLTTKRVWWKGVVEELLWFIRGSTSSKELEAVGVNIWKGNSTREFLESRGLDYEEGELGPVYGAQWRRWGGIDQLQRSIEALKKDPESRRNIVSAWNVSDLDKMALPPCHSFYQFHVDQHGLVISMYQRSADLFLGVPFNIASYSLLCYLVAATVGIKPSRLVMYFGNIHIYQSHLDAVTEQLSREPKELPTVTITPQSTIDDYTSDDILLENYNPHTTIKADMIA